MTARVKPLLKMALGASLFCALPLTMPALQKPAHAAETAAQRAGRAAIVAQYLKTDAAILRHDLPAIMTTLAADYKSYGMDGSVANRAQAEATMRLVLSGQINGVKFKFTKSQSTIQSLQWRGPDAIVLSQVTMVGIGSRDGKSVRVEVVGASRDYWGKTAQGWQIRQGVTLQMKRWINGVRDPSM